MLNEYLLKFGNFVELKAFYWTKVPLNRCFCIWFSYLICIFFLWSRICVSIFKLGFESLPFISRLVLRLSLCHHLHHSFYCTKFLIFVFRVFPFSIQPQLFSFLLTFFSKINKCTWAVSPFVSSFHLKIHMPFSSNLWCILPLYFCFQTYCSRCFRGQVLPLPFFQTMSCLSWRQIG